MTDRERAGSHLSSRTTRLIRASGVAGVLGGLSLVVADILITPVLPTGDESLVEALVEIRARIATPALYASGILGALAVQFYVFAAWHGYLALRPAGPKLAGLALAALASMLTSTGIFHAVFIAQNFGAKVALASSAAADLALSLPQAYSSLILNLLVIPSGILFTSISGYAILAGRSLYPRWFIAISPFVVLSVYMILIFPAGRSMPALFSFALIGNVYNFAIMAYFAASTIVLWKPRLVAE
jgi:hypothetical protein